MSAILEKDQLLCSGKYKICRCVNDDKVESVYEALDTENKKHVTLVIYTPPENISNEKLEAVILKFQDLVSTLKHFEHPNLARFYAYFTMERCQVAVLEKVEGLTLSQLIEMSEKPMEQTKVLGWAEQICAVLEYFQDRPRPFVYGDLRPDELLIDSEEKIRLCSFSVKRFFENPESYEAGKERQREIMCREFVQIGRIIHLLLTKKEVPQQGASSGESLSDAMVKFINALLSAPSYCAYKNFGDTKRAIELILHPPAVSSGKKKTRPWIQLIDYERLWNDGVYRFFSQPVWMIACEGAALVVGCIFIYLFFNPPVSERTSEALYVACGSEINIINPADGKVSGYVRMPAPIRALASVGDGTKLYCSSAKNGIIYTMNSITNRVVTGISLEPGVSKMIPDAGKKYLFAEHEESGHISVIGLNDAALPSDSVPTSKYKEPVLSIYSLGHGASGLVVNSVKPSVLSEIRADKDSKGGGTAGNTESVADAASIVYPMVFATSKMDNRVISFAYTPSERVDIADVGCAGAGSAVLSGDGSKLYVCRSTSSDVWVLANPKLNRVASLTSTGGTNPVQMMLSWNGKLLVVINRSGTLGTIDLDTGKLRNTVKLNGTPVAMASRPVDKGEQIFVAVSEPNKITVVDPDSGAILRDKIPLRGTPSDFCAFCLLRRGVSSVAAAEAAVQEADLVS